MANTKPWPVSFPSCHFFWALHSPKRRRSEKELGHGESRHNLQRCLLPAYTTPVCPQPRGVQTEAVAGSSGPRIPVRGGWSHQTGQGGLLAAGG